MCLALGPAAVAEYVHEYSTAQIAPEYIGVSPFVIMFLVAAITTQRERARSTL